MAQVVGDAVDVKAVTACIGVPPATTTPRVETDATLLQSVDRADLKPGKMPRLKTQKAGDEGGALVVEIKRA